MKTYDVYSNAARDTKWRQVLDAVRADIETGRFQPQATFYTVKELSRAYNISDITGRRVFQELKALNLIITNGRRGTTIAAQAGPKHKVFLCMRDKFTEGGARPLLSSRVFHETMTGLDGVPGGNLEVVPVSLDFILSYRDMFRGQDVLLGPEALLSVAAGKTEINHEFLAQLREICAPVILRGFAELSGITQVRVDYRAGILDMVGHLVGRGYGRLGFIGGNSNSPWFRPRFQGYLDGLHAAGLEFRPELVKLTAGNNEAEDQNAARELLAADRRPDAIICANDQRALNVLNFCRQQGIRVPDELALAGFDNIHEARLCQPGLTTIDPRLGTVAREALVLLKQRRAGTLREPAIRTIAPEIRIREST